MGWFNNNKSEKEKTQDTAAKINSVEIVTHQDSNKRVVKEAKEANERLNKLLVENGFTVKIFLAAGGKNNRIKRVGT